MLIADKTRYDKKIQAFKKDGVKAIHVLADFDRTLTKPVVNGQKVPSITSLLRDGKHISQEYAEAAHALFNHYHPIELDPNIPAEKKKLIMSEWWHKHFALLIKSGLQKSDLENIAKNPLFQLREGVKELFSLCAQHEIPFVIMSSSGTGTYAIQEYLKNQHALHPNVFVISNEYQWDTSGKAIAIKEPIIHIMNKDETLARDYPEIFSHIENRRNVLLLGDSISDLDMITGFEYEQLLTVGFLNENAEQLLPTYQKQFDVVLADDAPMDEMVVVLQTIFSA